MAAKSKREKLREMRAQLKHLKKALKETQHELDLANEAVMELENDEQQTEMRIDRLEDRIALLRDNGHVGWGEGRE